MDRYIQIGEILIGKGSKYVFEDIENIASGNTTQQENTYAGVDGADYSEICFTPRTFEIKGHILAESQEELKELKTNLIKACNPKKKTETYYFDGVKKYYAETLADGMPDFGKRISSTWFLPFVIYCKIPSFYWESGEEIECPIYKLIPLLSASFTFPGMFSKRIYESTLVNDGEAEVYPRVTLYCEESNGTELIIENKTLNKSIKIAYVMTPGEKITIDMYRCTINSSLNGSLLNLVDRIENFWELVPGENYIYVATEGITATINYRNRYIGV